jgi:hypothetical protein
MPGCEYQIVPIVLRNSGEIELTMAAEVSVSAHGQLKVRRVVLYQENSLKNGRIVESNFHDFPLLTVAGMPEDQPCAMLSLAPPASGCARCH